MPERQEITLDTPIIEALTIMAEGNPGALTVLARMAKGEAGCSLLDIFHLDDMNIRGTQIWVAYKDWAKEDLKRFCVGVRHRDVAMIVAVNAEGRRGNHAWLAVPHWQHDGHRRRIA